MEKKYLHLAVPACLAVGVGLIGVASARADSGAQAAAQGSPGVVSGELAQLPVHVPANVCGNTVDVVGLLNPVFGNQCANASAHPRRPSGEEGQEGAANILEPQGFPERPGHSSGHGGHTSQGPEGHPDRPAGQGLGKPQQNAQPSHAPSHATPSARGADHGKVSREQGPEASHLGMRSPEGPRPVGFTPVDSPGRVAAPKGSSDPAQAAGFAAPGSGVLAETGADDSLGLAALTALGIVGAGALMTRRAKSSRH